MQAEGKQKFKMKVGKIYRLMFDPDDDLREVDASEVGTRDEGQGLPSACSRLQNEPGRGRSRGWMERSAGRSPERGERPYASHRLVRFRSGLRLAKTALTRGRAWQESFFCYDFIISLYTIPCSVHQLWTMSRMIKPFRSVDSDIVNVEVYNIDIRYAYYIITSSIYNNLHQKYQNIWYYQIFQYFWTDIIVFFFWTDIIGFILNRYYRVIFEPDISEYLIISRYSDTNHWHRQASTDGQAQAGRQSQAGRKASTGR